ncbi:hypothetical protein B0F90DRAFT_1690546 [Multifurca ochricompacta]|uniref:Uncharacterized protein n=1 Tax=Multifurca ochricompacta TaxID=376703 RepID=A0AAD4MAK2_9AGAM|nr:hypothetical protein B0F90DRAFT_1690546 [Multifurca ochricompacta]
MSNSPIDDTYDDPQRPDEFEDGTHLAGNSDSGVATTPAKRGRGRPKGSKNKKNAAGTAASASELASAAGEKRKRGRPPKVCLCLEPITLIYPLIFMIPQPKNLQEEVATGEPPAKRKRGRPPKNPKPISAHEDVGQGGTSDSPVKRKRGRPPKNAA